MYCYNDVLLKTYLRDDARAAEIDRAIDAEAREEAQIMIESNPNDEKFNSIMEFISCNDLFITKFDKLVHSIINNASVESVENFQKFMFEVAYEVARIKVDTQYSQAKREY